MIAFKFSDIRANNPIGKFLRFPLSLLPRKSIHTDTVSLVKIDVEGAEANVLRAGEKFFQEHRPIILLATHGREQVNDCQAILQEYNYSMTLINKDLYGFGSDEWLVKPNNVNSI